MPVIGVAASGDPRLPAPGRGRITVASEGLNGSSKSGMGSTLESAADGPELERETRELTCEVERHAARFLELRPQLVL